MNELNAWFQSVGQNALVAKTGAIVLILIASLIGIRMLQAIVSRSVKDTSARYRIRKFVGFLGYVVLVLLLLGAFSDRLGQLKIGRAHV